MGYQVSSLHQNSDSVPSYNALDNSLQNPSYENPFKNGKKEFPYDSESENLFGNHSDSLDRSLCKRLSQCFKSIFCCGSFPSQSDSDDSSSTDAD